MTTIACNGIEMACDGFVTGGGTIHQADYKKIIRVGTRIVGWTGQPYFARQLHDFLSGNLEEIDFGEDFEAIILDDDGDCFCMDGKGREYKTALPAACGSGTQFALAAMRLGHSPYEAVKIACELDVTSGGEIFVVALPR